MKLSLVLVLFMSVLFMGCSKDKEESKEIEKIVKKTDMVKLLDDTQEIQVEQVKKSVVKNTTVAIKKKEVVTKTKVLSLDKLVWQDDTDVKNSVKNWKDAKSYCKKLKLAESNEWRLPDFDELLNIVEYKNYDSAINSGFKKVVPNLYWSVSQSASDTSKAWSIHFKDGSTKHSDKASLYYVRCVRDALGSGV